MKNRLARFFQNEKLSVPTVILLLTLFAYGLFAPRMGFYWDDWPFAWSHRFYGSAQFVEAFSTNRPILGPIFMLTTAIFGGNPVTWQIVGLVARFLLSLVLFQVLRLVFPNQKANVLWVIFLFTVYPGYGQQWVAFTHVNQEFIPLIFLLTSFFISIWILRNKGSQWMIPPALFFQVLGLVSTEYFFGLEIIRALFILKIFSETIKDKKKLLQKTVAAWFPYLIVWTLVALWYYFFYSSGAYRSYDVARFSSEGLSAAAVLNEFLNTIFLAGFTSWLRAFSLFAAVDGTSIQVFTFAILVVTALLVFTFIASVHTPKPARRAPKAEASFGWWALAIGFVGIFAGRLPSWAVGFTLRFDFDHDRFFVSMMLGASLFIIGLADLILKVGKSKVVVLSLLIGLCVSQQFWTADAYRRDWENQRAFFWELAWRMPALEENTLLLADELPFDYVFDLHLTAPVNWVLAPSLQSHDLPYMLFYIRSRLGSSLPSLEPGTPITMPFRTATFMGNTSQSITIYKEDVSCLRVLDPVYADEETVIGERRVLADAIQLSDPSLIFVDAPAPTLDETIFGPEPAHGWCYYYAKAELARQEGDWEQIVRLYEQAQLADLGAQKPVEYLPFIEAYAKTGDVETANELEALTKEAQPALCDAIEAIAERTGQPWLASACK
ncbi:MAG: hypothetical protein ACRDFQ_02135 [Anaerolineales bacterium]